MAPDPPTLVPGVDAPQRQDEGHDGPPDSWNPSATDVEGGPTPPPASMRRSGGRSSRRSRPPRRAPRRARRVKRIIRRIELWSVLKVSLVFYVCMYAVALGSLALLWGFAYSAGLVDNFEGFMSDVGFENWRFYGEEMFRRCAIIGGILVLTGALLTTLATALLNVISELTGGIKVVVIEADPPAAPAPVAPAAAHLGGGTADPPPVRRRGLRRRR